MKNVLLGCLLLLPAGLAAQQQPEQYRTLTVSAQGTVERAPDQAVLMLAVESEASNARDAARTNAGKMERVLSALRRAGIPADRIRTVGYDLQPVCTAGPGRATASDRRLPRAEPAAGDDRRPGPCGPALDAAIEAGANRAENLYFQLKDPSDARLEALRLATAKARREAEAVARAADERLGVVQAIHTDSYAPPPRPVEMYARAVAMDAMKVETPVEAGNLSITASVTIIYRLGS
jgi:uncharacterized protein YggE